MSKAVIVALGLVLGVLACREPSAPTPRVRTSSAPAFTISDGAHGASPRFYFLPPLVSQPTYSGTFDPTAFGAGSSDSVWVCQWIANACSGVVAGFGAGDVQVDLTTETYYVNWNTKPANLDPANQYRLLVRVSGQTVGYADLAVVMTGADKKNVDPTQFIPVIAGTVVPIHFRLETVPNQPPVAHFTVNCTYLKCTFDSSGSTDDAGITSRSWSFGDGGSAADVIAPTHTYASAGTYTVTLTVEDGGGLSDVTSQQVTVNAPPPPPPTGATISAGSYHTCAFDPNNTAYCWGGNQYGQLGDGTTVDKSIPTLVAGGHALGQVSAEALHSCALTTAGSAYCWGYNNDGEVGDGTSGNIRTTPTAVSGNFVFSTISAGGYLTCALTTAGAAYCWGLNGYGQVGDGTTGNVRTTPTAVQGGFTFATIKAGLSTTCGITTTSATYCWGWNGNGQVGDGTTTDRSTPTPVAVPSGVTFMSISAGQGYTCALSMAGAAYCWGDNTFGQLGDGTTTQRSLPTAVLGGLTFASISAGTFTTCGITAAGAAYCWGYNAFGQVGDGTSGNNRTAPAAVQGGLTFSAVTVGLFHTCGQTTAGAFYCWGANSNGAVGNGTTTGSTVAPTLISVP